LYHEVTKQRENLSLALEFLEADARPAVTVFNEFEEGKESKEGIQNCCKAMFKTDVEAEKYGPLVRPSEERRDELTTLLLVM
jgi:hypothetical protein